MKVTAIGKQLRPSSIASVRFTDRLWSELFAIQNGYLVLSREWSAGDTIRLSLQMPVEVVASHGSVDATAGSAALQRGPIVYCFEEQDNRDTFEQIALGQRTQYVIERPDNAHYGLRRIRCFDPATAGSWLAVPYFTWDNGDAGNMKVWVPYSAAGDGERPYHQMSRDV